MKPVDLTRALSVPLRTTISVAPEGLDALILSDPVNIRYATGARNMQIFCARNAPSRYLLLTLDRSILYEFTGCEHLAAGLETVDEEGGPSYPVITGDYDATFRWESRPVAVGTPLTVPAPLFTKLDPSVVDEELGRLEGNDKQ